VLTVRKLLIAAVLIVQAFTPAAAETSAPSWWIVQKAGEVSVSTGGFFPVALNPKAALPEGAIVTTGVTGRAILRRGAEQIALDPRSRIVLTASSSGATYIRQDAGSAFFTIGKRRAPHFEVGTPFLAAIVKGTSFRVNVNGAGAAVHVSEGAVEVATVFRSAVTLVKPGAGALVRAAGKGQIQLVKDGHPTRIVTSNEGGWEAPASPEAIGGGDAGVDAPSIDAGAPDIDSGIDTSDAGGGGSLLRASANLSGVTEAAPRPHASSERPSATSNAGGAKADLASTTGYAAIPASAGKEAMSAYRTSRAGRRSSNTDIPMYEIGLGLLGLFLFMLASHARGLMRRARVRR
jgi:hypothetical protein